LGCVVNSEAVELCMPGIGPPEKIAVIQTAFLGDVVFTSPLCRALKRAFPKAHLTFVSTPRALPVAAAIPGVDRLLSFDKKKTHRGLSGIQNVAAQLESPELVVVPHLSPRSALLAFLSKAKGRQQIRIGWSSFFLRPFFTYPIVKERALPFVRRSLKCLEPLAIEASTDLELRVLEEEVDKARKIPGIQNALGLAIGSERATKRWPAPFFARLADETIQRKLTPIFLGAPNEMPIAREVLSLMKQPQHVLNLVGNSLSEAMGVIALLKGMAGGDSGLLHIGRALKIPSLILFGPTNPRLHELEPHARALSLWLQCQPCHRHGPKQCPRGHLACLRQLEVAKVAAELTSMGVF